MTDWTCRQVILDLLIEYEEGTMAAEDREDFERHIEMCPPCVRFLTTYRATGRTLKLLKPEEIPVDLAQSVLAFVRARTRRESGS
jgi:anti-sigma factor RsiW